MDKIKAIVNESQPELIVIFTHGKVESKVFLGSTPNAVLHGANQDALTVHMNNN